ncbi:MAG: hypothetical protein ACI8RZ_000321 [Myxococcota bacterium]|jgi:uncharacterized protein YjbI with pentapeptide repeats
MPLSDAQLSQIRSLLQHRDSAVQAQGQELLVTLAQERNALRGHNLARTHLERIDLSGRDLRDINLTGAWLEGANLRGADLRGATLDEAALSDAVLEGADLSGASMRDAVLSGAMLTGARLHLLDLRGATVHGALPMGARVIVNRQTTLHGRPARAMWLDIATDQPRLDLSGLTLTGLRLQDSDLQGADLSGGCFRRARLSHCDLTGANLSGAALHRARLRGTWLRGADLSGADLSFADLSGADLTGADLTGTDLTRANLTNAIGADLSGARTDGVWQRNLVCLPDITPEARLAQLCDDPDWTLRRLGLLHQARTGDASAALAGFIAAEANTDSAEAALMTVLHRYTVADLTVLPERFRRRRWLLAIAGLAEERDPVQASAVLLASVQSRAVPLTLLIEAVHSDIWPDVRHQLQLLGDTFADRKLKGAAQRRDRSPPPPTPLPPILRARVQDEALPERSRLLALNRLLQVRIIDAETHALLMKLVADPSAGLAAVATHWMGSLTPDVALLERLARTTSRNDKVGGAAVNTLVTLGVRHPAHTDAIIDSLLPLLSQPLSAPRDRSVRHGLFGLLRISAHPNRTALLGRCGLHWSMRHGAMSAINQLKKYRTSSLIERAMVPDLLYRLWQDPGSSKVSILATAPDVALPIAADGLTGPWSVRARVALRLCEAIGPAAAALIPLIRPHLAHPDPAVQRAAAAALGAIGDPVARPWLATLSQAPDRHLRRVAVRALVKLTVADIA